MKYRTTQSSKLNAFFLSNKDKLFSIEDAISNLEGIGKSTIYRQFANAEKKGIIKRVDSDKGLNLYQYVNNENGCLEHFHLVCKECGCFIHLDSDESNHIIQEFKNRVGFEIVSGSTLFGKCSKCREKRCLKK